MFKFSAQPKTILRGSKPPLAVSKTPENKPPAVKPKVPLYIPIGTNLLPQKNEKLSDPNEYFHCNKIQPTVYVPLPRKINKGTQIFSRDWLLFDFDKTVEPVLEALMAQILKMSKTEIRQENEADYKTKKLFSIKRARNSAFMKTKHLMSHEERVQLEIRNRRTQRELQYQTDYQQQKKFVALNFAKFSIIGKVFTDSLNSLQAKQLTHLSTTDQLNINYGTQLLKDADVKISTLQNHEMLSDHAKNDVVSRITRAHQVAIDNHSKQLADQKFHDAATQAEHESKLKENQRLRHSLAENTRKQQIERYFTYTVFNKFQIIKDKDFFNANFVSLRDFIVQTDSQKQYIGFIFEPLIYLNQMINHFFPDNFEAKFRQIIVELLKLNFKNLTFSVSEEFFAFTESVVQKKMQSEEVSPEEIDKMIGNEAELFVSRHKYPAHLIDTNRTIKILNGLFALKCEAVERVAKSLKHSSITTPESTLTHNEINKQPIAQSSTMDIEKFIKPEKIVFVPQIQDLEVKADKNFYLTRINFPFFKTPKPEVSQQQIVAFKKLKQFYQFDGSLYEQMQALFDLDLSSTQIKSFSSQGYNLFIQNRVGFYKFISLAKESLEKSEGIQASIDDLMLNLETFENEFLSTLKLECKNELLIFDIEG